MHSGKLTKIIATIGPACDDADILKKMILAGVNIFRFNMKHNVPEWHLDRIKLVQSVADKLKIQIGVLIDLQGPEIRIETAGGSAIHLSDGEELLFTDNVNTQFKHKNEQFVRIPHSVVLETLKIGDTFKIEDGYHEFEVVKKLSPTNLYAKTLNSGVIKNRKSLNLVGIDVNLPSLIEEDLDKLDQACKAKVDFVALSFARTKEDILTLQKEIEKRDIAAHIVAKIESQLGLDNIDQIIDASDSIMIARGDLGIEAPIEKLTYYQKSIIQKCRSMGKPVIVATQMLESMIYEPLPTRAEAADVANAAYDKTDCVMLSGETATGKYPVKSVQTITKIIKFNELKSPDVEFKVKIRDQTHSVVKAGYEIVQHEDVYGFKINKIVVFTETGYTARAFSSYRPKVPIIAVSDNPKTVETLTMSFGVLSHLTKFSSEEYKEPPEVLKHLVKCGLLDKGDKVLVVHGRKWMDEENTNAVAVLDV